MPWVDQEMCTSCGICVEACPVGAIALDEQNLAEIHDAECIRCGRCHDVCPVEAVRHDSERIPLEVTANLQWVRRLLDHFDTPAERRDFMDRIGRHFNKEKKVVERTLAAIGGLGDDIAAGLDAAIHSTQASQDRAAN